MIDNLLLLLINN